MPPAVKFFLQPEIEAGDLRFDLSFRFPEEAQFLDDRPVGKIVEGSDSDGRKIFAESSPESSAIFRGNLEGRFCFGMISSLLSFWIGMINSLRTFTTDQRLSWVRSPLRRLDGSPALILKKSFTDAQGRRACYVQDISDQYPVFTETQFFL